MMTFEQAMAWHQAGRPADEKRFLREFVPGAVSVPAPAVEPDPFAYLVALRDERTDLSARERAAVDRARLEGASWQVIADALGMSQPGAIKKFSSR